MEYILAIDQGTTGSRAIIYDKKGIPLFSAYEEFPQYFPKPGWVEHNPQEIWKSVNNSIQKVLKNIDPKKVKAIGITNQRETTVVWDKKTGKPIYNAIVWQCRRTAQRCEALKKKKGLAGKIYKKTGLPIDAYFSSTKIEWILKKTGRKDNLAFGTTDSWVLWNLTGKEHKTDYSNASRTMLFNIEKLEWDKDLLKLFNIPAKILPKVQGSSSLFGKTKKIGLLPEGIPICGIAGDQQAALFGQACFDPGTIKNTYGTGCFLLLNVGKKRPKSKNGLITTIGVDGKGKPVYILEGSIFIAGAAIQWIRDKLQIVKKSFETEKMAQSLEDNGGVYFVPAFVGLGAPYWNQNARGIICGLTRGTTKEHIARAAIESMCYSTKDVLSAMEKDTGLKIKELKIDGGASANNFLCQFQANILEIEVVRPKIVESTSLGAAYLAGLYAKIFKSPEEIKKLWKKDKTFLPNIGRTESKKLYLGWKEAVGKCLYTT